MNVKFIEFVGCPHPFCRSHISEIADIRNMVKNEIIVRSDRASYFIICHDEIACIKCKEKIGYIDEEGFLHLRCYIYRK